MSTRIEIDLSDLATPRVERLIGGLSSDGRESLHTMLMNRLMESTREHLREIALERHDTAERLGAAPSGFWGQAAERTTGEASADGATISVHSPGIGRALHDVVIEPGAGKKFLTIPLIAEAYNQRAYRVEGLFVPPGTRVLAKSDGQGGLEVWYALVASVTQKQDRTLLPSDEEYQGEGKLGVLDYIDYLLGGFEGKEAA